MERGLTRAASPPLDARRSAEYIGGVMFDSIEPQRQGFAGRPLAALLFAIGLGIVAYYAGSLLQLGQVVREVTATATVVIVHYGWRWMDRPRSS